MVNEFRPRSQRGSYVETPWLAQYPNHGIFWPFITWWFCFVHCMQWLNATANIYTLVDNTMLTFQFHTAILFTKQKKLAILKPGRSLSKKYTVLLDSPVRRLKNYRRFTYPSHVEAKFETTNELDWCVRLSELEKRSKGRLTLEPLIESMASLPWLNCGH